MSFDLEQITFKDFSINDYDAVLKLWKLAGLPVKDKGRDCPEKIEEELKRGIAHFILAQYRSELIGVALVTHDGRKGWINRIAVHPDYRRKGLARLLVEKAEKHLNEIGIEIVACLIEDYNTNSLLTFQKLGYVDFEGIHYLTKRKNPEV